MNYLLQMGGDGGASLLDFFSKGGALASMVGLVWLLLSGKLITSREFNRVCAEKKELEESNLKWQSKAWELMSMTKKLADNADRGIGVAEKVANDIAKGSSDARN